MVKQADIPVEATPFVPWRVFLPTFMVEWGANDTDQDRHGRKQNTGRPTPDGKTAQPAPGRDVPGGPAHGGGSGRDRSGSLG